MKLDRNKPFGTVYGSADHVYEQDGKHFDHEGLIVGGDEPKADAPKKMGRPPKVEAPTPEDSQLSAQMSE